MDLDLPKFQKLDADPHWSKKLDADPHESEERDPDSYEISKSRALNTSGHGPWVS